MNRFYTRLNTIIVCLLFGIFFTASGYKTEDQKDASFEQYNNDYYSEPSVRRIDPSRLKEIVYPPLTDREGKDLMLPVPPAEHPRLFFRKMHLAEIKIKANHPLLKDCWERIYQNANFTTDGKLAQGVVMNYNLRIINAIEAKAFMYAITGDIKMGNEAVDLIFNLNNTLIINPEKQDVCREIGRVLLATAVVYDWCYDLITPAEKKSLIAIMESLAVDLEVKWPLLVQGSVVGHGPEAQLLRDILSFGIATYNEKPEIYRRAAGRIFGEMIPVQKFWYQSGHHHQGSAYGPYRFQWEMYPTLLFDRMGFPNVNSELQGKIPYYWIYTRRPDGKFFHDGDDWVERNPFGFYWIIFDLAYTASYYKDPLLMGEAIKQGTIGQNPLYDLLLIDPTVSPDYGMGELPLTKYFPYPFGGMVARTGWDNGFASNIVVAEMRVVERRFGLHQHFQACGSFQIYYKGPLTVRAGIYEGVNGGFGSSHYFNYYQRAIAHNCMLVYDPDETFVFWRNTLANDGGQRFQNNGSDPAHLEGVMSDFCKLAEVLESDFGPNAVTPEYSYLKGDITNAYSDKVRNHQRSFVFLNLNNAQVPAAMIVYDYITASNKDFKKTWLLQCVQEPVFNGNESTLVRNENGYGGKLLNTTLLPVPQNTILAKVGGPGNEYSINGTNYPNRLRLEKNAGDGAIWRIELSPKTPAETDVFLNVMQVTDAENNRLLNVEKIETDRLVGAQIGDRIVLFSKNGTTESLPVNLNIKGNGFIKVLITDLEKGNWDVTGPASPGMVRNDQNLVYFQAKAGNYLITKK